MDELIDYEMKIFDPTAAYAERLRAALRERAALAALTGLLANEAAFGPRFQGEWGAIVAASVDIADALVSRLKEGK